MNIDVYMDPAAFPATTQPGLTPAQQMMIDAVNYDDLAEYARAGRPMTPAQAAAWAELQQKRPAFAGPPAA